MSFWKKTMIVKNCKMVATLCAISLTTILTSGCTPVVRIEASDKPITINLNVKIEHEIRVKVEKEVDEMLSEDSGLF
ncbi:MAG: hypothetical protein ACI93R_003626 [Flavobacteriales bacterium]|jgi:hypothetical protein